MNTEVLISLLIQQMFPILLIITMLIISHNYIKYKKEKDEKDRIANLLIDDDFIYTIDYVIESEFNLYLILHPITSKTISGAASSQYVSEITKEVLKRLSPKLREKMEYVYKDDMIDEVIVRKVALLVANTCGSKHAELDMLLNSDTNDIQSDTNMNWDTNE